jgi:hypothetical protein
VVVVVVGTLVVVDPAAVVVVEAFVAVTGASGSAPGPSSSWTPATTAPAAIARTRRRRLGLAGVVVGLHRRGTARLDVQLRGVILGEEPRLLVLGGPAILDRISEEVRPCGPPALEHARTVARRPVTLWTIGPDAAILSSPCSRPLRAWQPRI